MGIGMEDSKSPPTGAPPAPRRAQQQQPPKPPPKPKPASAVPPYMLNGKASVRMPSNPRERQSLEASIKNSFDRKPLIDEGSRAISARTPIIDSHHGQTVPD
ncbi:hypothetical protein KEM52_006099 [Ascosphaera acerosa]|nr:hypothetical protein KEM52_006099 [Ascosphaera acerosa]